MIHVPIKAILVNVLSLSLSLKLTRIHESGIFLIRNFFMCSFAFNGTIACSTNIFLFFLKFARKKIKDLNVPILCSTNLF